MVKGLKYILLLLLPLLFVQCQHKELCYSQAVEVEVRFDWSQVPEPHVAGMTTYFYPLDNSSAPVRRDFQDKAGGSTTLRDGRYRVVGFNNTSSILQHRGEEHFETLESFTRSCSPLSGALLSLRAPSWDEGKDFRLQPEPFYAGRVKETKIVPQADGTSRQVVTIVMEPRYREVQIRLTNVQGLQAVQGISAGLGGVAPSYFIGLDKWHEGSVYHPIAMKWKGQEVEGNMITYGFLPKAKGGKQELILYVVMADGKGYTYTFDVTEQVEQQKGKAVIDIKLDEELPLPRIDESARSGLSITVESWRKVYLNIKM
ncbi:hypothetical protein HMPREF3027_01860 [Porphyromonas sp. HMSC077F02]|uniref:DUF5119 domain-containing protein n=1 Tax=Porphyromonas sp. HMSC077F02 TaxID=1739529 RepID=UPI0008A57008|nr:DUF5119 domain-containing protein [Porphyromonas sp. HMSC077F02]OFO56523.1 hypothetical protein HMPREF3027_01860 [Porphyromonas sp. HMSC077F02]